MARSRDEEHEGSPEPGGWDATTTLVLVGMVALAIVVGLIFS